MAGLSTKRSLMTSFQRYIAFRGFSTQVADAYQVKSLDQMPVHDAGRVKFMGISSILYFMKNSKRFHEATLELHEKLGPIFRQHAGPITQIYLGNAQVLEDALRHLGKYPLKPEYVGLPWHIYRQKTGESSALLTCDGDEWHKYRSVISKRMLRPSMLTNYEEEVNEIVTDMIDRLKSLRDADMTVPDLTNEMYRWAMETVCKFLFESRLGLLKDPMPPKSQGFINAVADMLSTTQVLGLFPTFHVRFKTKPWVKHYKAWDTIFEVARYYTDKRMNEIVEDHKKGLKKDDDNRGEFLTYLLSSEQLSNKQIYANVSEIMLAGVDTTSNTLAFTCNLLANNPLVQQKLQTEVDNILGGKIARAEDLTGMPYLKMVIKESMRVHPVVPLHVRMVDQELIVGGYRLPPKTPLLLNNYASCMDPNVFENPKKFIPERWDRDSGNLPNPFGMIPFGFGPRGCVGRRLAELELHMALARVAQNFNMLPSNRYKLEPEYRGTLSPGEQIPVEFHDRK